MALVVLNIVKCSLRSYSQQNNTRLISSVLARDMQNEKKENLITKKFTELNDWYITLTGLDEVKRLQDKVIVTQEKLEKAQEERREAGKSLAEIRKKSSEIQEQLQRVKKWDDVQRYLDLTREETELMKTERELTRMFEMLDKTEREIFTLLSNAVRDSHEKEKAQAEYTKYWGIILSIIGTIVGAVASTMITTIRNHQIVNGINDGVEEKFVKIVNMMDEAYQIKHGNMENIVTQIQKEYSKVTQPILEKLNETQSQIGTLMKYVKSEYLLSSDKVKQGDRSLDVGSFIVAQKNLLLGHQDEIRTIVLDKRQNESSGYNRYYVYGALALLFLVLVNR